nr:carotenoid biosynthesis protein [Bacteroidales bacterium]
GKMEGGFIWKALFIFCAGILIEIIGVKTGVIFGSYAYGPTLGIKILHTPIVIGVNWLMLVYGSLYITSQFIDVRYFRIVIASVLMVIYDFALEPVAIALEMWDWAGPVPLQNYIAWFIISFLLIWFADKTGLVNKRNKIAAPLFYIQLGFFIVLNIWLYIK